jgi:hypothetical protein
MPFANRIPDRFEAVTPDDGTDLPDGPCIGLIAQVAGNVSVDDVFGNTAVVMGIAAGVLLEGQFVRVRSTSTTATGLVAVYVTR